MPTLAIIGGQWGDEGKGKLVDLLAGQAKAVVRFCGGDNAGHTIINSLGIFRMHLVPSGVFHPGVACLIGNGVVINPEALFEELDNLHKHGVSTDNLYISDRAHLIMPYHTLIDALEEESRGKGALGTTKRGIGPAYADKAARLGIRAGELLDKEAFLRRLREVLEYKNSILTKVYGAEPLSVEEVYQQYCQYGERLVPFIREVDVMLQDILDRGELVLLEGAQGTLLDIDFGTYPYVTSSSPAIGGACCGVGLSPTKIDSILCIFKAYATRVGSGPMPTELGDKTGELIRETAQEYGATTGRPRRCGWFDAVLARYSVRINGCTAIALTRFDILDKFTSIKLCTAYDVDGTVYTHPMSNISLLERCQPIYEELPGWQQETGHIRRFQDLPEEAKAYAKRIEELLGCPIALISVGPEREQAIMVRDII
jgi:adenylosuccinate synthase